MRRREFITLLAGAAAAWPLAARAQQPNAARRIGALLPFDARDTFGQQIIGALRGGLAEHGWVEGRNIDSDIRWIGDDEDRRRAYAAELVRASPDVIFACFAAQLAALRRETQKIPLVFVGVTDPVQRGFVASVARPGGNVTGFTFFEQSMVGKWLEVLKEIAPALTRVGVVVNPETAQSYELYLAEFAIAAAALKVETTSLLVHSAGELERAIAELARSTNSGFIVLPDTFTTDHRKLIVALAARYRLPAVYQFGEAARAGGLASYGTDQIDVIRRSASYIDRILRGEQPSELPVQAPTKFELVVNLKTAKTLGLEVSPALLARADEVIE